LGTEGGFQVNQAATEKTSAIRCRTPIIRTVEKSNRGGKSDSSRPRPKRMRLRFSTLRITAGWAVASIFLEDSAYTMETPTINRKKGKMRSVGAAVPSGMFQRRVDVRLVARVVHQDHGCHGDAPEYIEQ